MEELTQEQLLYIIFRSIELKKQPQQELLNGKTLGMIFEKPSLRTRVSFEAEMTQLGGHAIYLDTSGKTLHKKEDLKDTNSCFIKIC